MSGGTDLLRFAESFLDKSSNERDKDGGPASFDSAAMPGLYDIQAHPGHIKCFLKVGKTHANFMGNLHGGCTGKRGQAGDEMGCSESSSRRRPTPSMLSLGGGGVVAS